MGGSIDVLTGSARFGVDCADALEWLAALPDDSIDLLFTSPPYELARTYGIGENMLSGQAWVDWMVKVFTAAAPKVKGLIAMNCEGQTRNYNYSGVPFLLFADLKRAGFNMRKPPVFHRVGIPGSGGPDWLRNDYEPVICVTRPGRLTWSDNTACGHPPKWAPGGEMSHRLSDGTKRNAHGVATDRPVGTRPYGDKGKSECGKGEKYRAKKSVPTWLREGMHTGVQNKIKNPKSNRQIARENGVKMPAITSGMKDGDTELLDSYLPPTLANPGNVIEHTYTAAEVAELLNDCGDVLKHEVGGGMMGHACAHSNEAPFPLGLCEFFIKSFCPPGGIAADPFCGSGTLIHAAIEHGRRGIGCDVRASQVALTLKRMKTVTPPMFTEES